MDQRALEDEARIRALVATYAQAVARRDAATWGATWADDGQWNVLGQAPQGRAAVVALWEGLMTRFPVIVHRATDGLVCVEGDTATGAWSITEQGKTSEGDGILLLGHYDDAYVRTAEGWRFQRRTLSVFYQGPPDLSGPLAGA